MRSLSRVGCVRVLYSFGMFYNSFTMDGIILLDKQPGVSSFDLIRHFKKRSGFNGKVGHAGTLDVFASGLLILLLGKSTKRFDEFLEYEKVYVAGSRLGLFSETLDIEGEPEISDGNVQVTVEEIEEASEKFIGDIEQDIPKYSAAKQGGKRSYKLARDGKEMKQMRKVVTVNSVEVVGIKPPLVTLEISCSSGTYIRQLAYDILRELGVDSLLFSLRRTKIGPFSVSDAVDISQIEKDNLSELVDKR